MARLERYGVLVPLVLALLALALRLWQLERESIWLDEAYTAYHSTLPAWDHWVNGVVNKPPLFYHLTALFWSPGDGAFALRLPAALFGALSVFLSWYLGRALDGPRGGWLMAGLMLISSLNVQYSQEARHYTMLTVGWVLVVWALVMLLAQARLERPAGRGLIVLGAGVLIMLHSHPIAGHYLVAAAVSYVAALAMAGRLARPWLLPPLLVCLLAGLTVVPWLFALSHLAEAGGLHFDWLEQPNTDKATSLFFKQFSGGKLVWLLSYAGLLLYARRRRPPEGVLLLGLLTLPPLFLWLTGLVKPVYMLRTLVPGHVVAMAGLALLPGTLRQRKAALAVAVLAVLALSISTYSYFGKLSKEDWRGLTQYWRDHAAPGDMMLLCRPHWYYPVWFYLGDGMPPVYALRKSADGQARVLDTRAAVASRCLGKDCEALLLPRLPLRPATIWVVDGGSKSACQVEASGELVSALAGADYRPGVAWVGLNARMAPYARHDAGP